MNKLWRNTSDSSTQYGMAEMKSGEVDTSKPVVIFLSGFSTTNTEPRSVKAVMTHVEKMLDGTTDQVAEHINLYAWQYESKRSNIKNIFNYNCRPSKAFSNSALTFVYDHFLPLMVNDPKTDLKKKTASGTLKPYKEIEKAFDKITLMSYSYGGVFSQEVHNAMIKTMNDLGFNQKRARSLVSKIHLVSMGSMSRPTFEKNRFTSITMVATNDRMAKHKSRIWWSLKEMFARASKKLTVKKLSKRSYYVTAPVQRHLFEERVDKEGNMVMRNIRKLFPKWWPRNSYHELPHYTTDRDDDNQFSKIARYALLNSIKRTARLSPLDMIQPTAPLIGDKQYTAQENAKYKKRVAAGIR